MLQALTAPAFKSVVFGGALLAASAVMVAPEGKPTVTTHRLVLHAVEEPNALYLTAWEHGDVTIRFEEGRLRPLTFTTRAWITDGCKWQGTETLVPIDGHSFAYDYSETILECAPDAVPAYKTPRKGLVTVDSY